MGGPKEVFRTRPKKSAGKKRQKVKAQKKKLLAGGLDEAVVEKMTNKEVREALKEVQKKQ